MDEVVETPEVASDVVVETIEETPVVEEVVETVDAEETPTEDVPASEEVAAETTEDVPQEVTFDTNAAFPELKENITKILDDYELPQPIQTAIDALIAKAEAAPTDSFVEFADYAPAGATPDVVVSTVKELLDRQTYLDSVTETSPGTYRPNTDKFAETIHKTSPEKADWLHYDLARLPSTKYQGLNKFEEGIADSLAREGDTVQSVITRYNQAMSALRNGVGIAGDAPAFIPTTLREAYWSLSKEERDELDSFDPSLDRIEYDDFGKAVNVDEAIRQRKIDTLAKIQKGIDGDKLIAQTQAQQESIRQQEFAAEVAAIQTKFYDAVREAVTTDVMKIKFSDDTKMQTILAHQNVAFLGQALEEGSAGDSARQILKDAGITFDYVKAQQLQKDIELASVALAQAKLAKDASGNVLNPIELNKANSQLKKTTQAWQDFAKNILDQQARLVSTGTAEAVKKEAEKIKVAPKARAAAKGVGTLASKEEKLPPYGTPEWDRYFAQKTLKEREERAMQQAKLYQTV